MTFLCTVPLQRVSRDSVTIISAFIIIIIIVSARKRLLSSASCVNILVKDGGTQPPKLAF